MTRAGGPGLLLLFVILLPLAFPRAAVAEPARQALVITVNGVSFEELMAVPEMRQLTRGGGVGLMTTARDGSSIAAAYAAVWGGAPVPARAGASLLYRTLRSGGVRVCQSSTNAELLETAGGVTQLSGPARGASCLGGPRLGLDGGFGAIDVALGSGRSLRSDLRTLGRSLRRDVMVLPARRTLVMVVVPGPSPAMDAVGDEVTPLVLAVGLPSELFLGNGPLHALTSDTTRQEGLVANLDVAPTVLRFFGIPIPSGMVGEPARATDGPAPFALQRRELEQRRIRLPLQMGELAFLVLGAILLTIALWGWQRGELSSGAARAARFLCVLGSSLPLCLLAGGGLPRFTYAWVVPFLAASMLVTTVLALRVGPRWGRWGPFAFVGLVSLGLLVLDSVLGGRSMRMPLFGGTMFDGARFYGLPNGFLPMLLAGALFVAVVLPPRGALAVLVAAGLFAGFPSLGADIGGAVTLFFAAGMWWVLRTRRRLGVAELGLVAILTVAGLVVVLLANRWLPGAPTHATRFVEATGSRPGHLVSVVADRLAIGVRLIARFPAAVLPLIGFAIILWLVVRRVGPVGRGLVGNDEWRDLLIVLVLASFVAYVANDTGAAAADPAFIYAMGGIAYPAMLLAERRRDPEPARPAASGVTT